MKRAWHGPVFRDSPDQQSTIVVMPGRWYPARALLPYVAYRCGISNSKKPSAGAGFQNPYAGRAWNPSRRQLETKHRKHRDKYRNFSNEVGTFNLGVLGSNPSELTVTPQDPRFLTLIILILKLSFQNVFRNSGPS